MLKALNYLYMNWGYICLPIALYVTIVLLSSASSLNEVILLIWLQFPVYLLHQFEEHAYPGTFKEYTNKEVFHTTQKNVPFNDVNIFWINAILIWLLFPLCAVLAQNSDIRFGAILPYISLFNATLHIIRSLITRKYNPGLIASVVLNYPLALYALYLMNKAHVLDFKTNVYAFLIALIAHVIIAVYSVRSYKKFKKHA